MSLRAQPNEQLLLTAPFHRRVPWSNLGFVAIAMTLVAPALKNRLGAIAALVVAALAFLIPLGSPKAERRRVFLGVCIGTVLIVVVVVQTANHLNKTP